MVGLEKDASLLIEGKVKSKDIGKTLLPCSYGGVSYYDSCDLGSSINVIPYTTYQEILDDISPYELYNTDITVLLADRTVRIPTGIFKNGYLNVGPHTFPTELVVMDIPHDPLCHLWKNISECRRSQH
jgi:hypothetical protein